VRCARGWGSQVILLLSYSSLPIVGIPWSVPGFAAWSVPGFAARFRRVPGFPARAPSGSPCTTATGCGLI
jgi:hypothetical protein